MIDLRTIATKPETRKLCPFMSQLVIDSAMPAGITPGPLSLPAGMAVKQATVVNVPCAGEYCMLWDSLSTTCGLISHVFDIDIEDLAQMENTKAPDEPKDTPG